MLLKKRFMFFAALALLICVGQAAAGPNANAVVSLDLIADGGAGNQTDDGVTSGTVSGQGTKIAVEVFAKDVTTSLIGMKIEFDYDASVLTYVKAENSAFAFIIPDHLGVNLAGAAPVTLPSSGFLARAEFSTVADVTGREFSIGVRRVTFAESATSSDVVTTTAVIKFNAAPSPDFDGDGEVGISDFLRFVDHYGTSQGDGKYQAKYDLDSNGVIEIPDFLIFVDNYGKTVTSSGDGGGEQIVDIPDANLRAVIAESLGKASGEAITSDEMSALTRLYAPNKGISDLTGLEFATNLQTLNLGSESVYIPALFVSGYVNSNAISDFSALSSLTNLTWLDLDSSGISDPSALVSAISGLPNLQTLELSNNSISDISALSSLTNLTSLNLGGVVYSWSSSGEVTLRLDNNAISDVSPLSSLTNLQSLNLSGNDISDFSPLSSLTNLTDLTLIKTTISNHLSSLSSLTGLTHLNLGGNTLLDLSFLSSLTSLTSLNLFVTTISDVSALSGLPNLQKLDISYNSVSDISALSSLTSLTWLELGSNSISDISSLSNLTNLTSLRLGRNSISNISVLSGLTNLTRLVLSYNNISDISHLSGLTNLTTLWLPGNSISDISPLANLIEMWQMSLSSNTISDISPLANLARLRYLYLSNNSISDLAPLVSNTGLDSRDEVDVRSNPLSDTSLNTHIPALQARGVTVLFGSSKPAVGETERRMPREVMKRFGLEAWEKEGTPFERQ